MVLSDCTAEPIAHDLPRSNHEASLLAIEYTFGWVTDSTEVIRALSATAKGTRSDRGVEVPAL